MAKQMILSFDVENQTLKRKDENKIVEKSKNYVHAIFFFSEEWDDTQKAAIIENGGMRFKVYLENNECDIPNRAVSHDGFTITIVGEDEEKNITITTTDLFIAVQKNNASDIQEEYIKNITSDTLDVEKENETCNLEIKDEEKFYYEMQENDFSNVQYESGNQWRLDLSETLENVITEFKKRIGVDWKKLGLRPPVSDMSKCVYTPTKKIIMVGDEEITYYMLSAVDSYGDTSVNFHYQNDSWHVTFTTGNFVDNETFNLRMADKQDVLEAGEGITISGNEISTDRSKVVANPTLSGDEPTLEGAEIDGIKYKVGGGGVSYKYLHSIQLTVVDLGVLAFSIKNNDSNPFTKSSLNMWLEENGYIGIIFYSVNPISVGSWGYAGIGISKHENSVSTIDINCLTIVNNKLAQATTTTGGSSTIIDTVTEV